MVGWGNSEVFAAIYQNVHVCLIFSIYRITSDHIVALCPWVTQLAMYCMCAIERVMHHTCGCDYHKVMENKTR